LSYLITHRGVIAAATLSLSSSARKQNSRMQE
jgi:hypothetical protein